MPDGKRLYYSKGYCLHQKDLPPGAEIPVPGLEEIEIDRYWDISTSASIYVPFNSSQVKNKPGIYRFDLQTGMRTLFSELDKLPIPWQLGLSVTPDESHHAISLVNQQIGDIMIMKWWDGERQIGSPSQRGAAAPPLGKSPSKRGFWRY